VRKCTAGLAIEQKPTISACKYLVLGTSFLRGNHDRPLYCQYPGCIAQIEGARNTPVVGPTTLIDALSSANAMFENSCYTIQLLIKHGWQTVRVRYCTAFSLK
jgi:hypothetical protein